jgi:hypothetical protein
VKTHHSTRKNQMVHTVASPHSRKFSVTRRVPFLPSDPEWVVFEGGNGPGADVVAHFFSEADARDYAKWRESQPSPRN